MYSVLFPVNELKIGGAEQQLLELVRGIDKTRFHPIVAPLYPNGALTPEFKAIPGAEVFDLRRRSKYDPSPLWRIALLLKRRQIDIIQPFLSPATFFGLLPALAVSTPVIVATERCGVRRVRGRGYHLYRSAEDHLSRFADVIIPNSKAGEEMLRERKLPDWKIRVIYNGISDERLTVDPDQVAQIRSRFNDCDNPQVVGILASLTPAKGHDTLIRSIAALRDRFPNVRLAIVGDGASRASLESLTTELGITDRVIFFGYQRNVADFLSSFDLLVSASRDNEGCSNSILEAMALGVPVIATNTGGNQELAQNGHTGLLVPADDVTVLSQAIAGVLEAPDEAAAMAQRAREMIGERFSVRRMVSDYEALYLRLLGKAHCSMFDADGQVVYRQDREVFADQQ